MDNQDMEYRGSYPPWSRTVSLNEMTGEAGIDFDQFVSCIEEGMSNSQMAERFQLSEAAVNSLTEHFFHYGIGSVMGGD
ncbi:MAG: helix-turn-helix domain-containing protein [Syntrophomonadaceae bacterium]|nr:helix-turn-helix domain-containing protein [Syntrophomonadaceae bacterium]MDD3023233.1 helix-turn-helix domain-containing protein [Syntrophomonadaceae bacterium]